MHMQMHVESHNTLNCLEAFSSKEKAFVDFVREVECEVQILCESTLSKSSKLLNVGVDII